MPEASLLIARSLKLLAEIALFAWLGQLLLGALLGAARDRNVVYGLFTAILWPVRWFVHRLPAAWPLRRRRVMAAVLLALVWAAALAWKVTLCVGGAVCR